MYVIYYKVGCVFPMVDVSILLHAEFGQIDHRKDALHFTIRDKYCLSSYIQSTQVQTSFSLAKCSEFCLLWRFWVSQWYFVIVLVKSDFPIFGLILSHEKSLMANWDYVWFKSVTLKYRIKSYSVYMWPHPTDSVGPRRKTRCFKCRTLRLSFDYKRS